MGCDIHGTIEKKVNNKWVMVDRVNDDMPAMDRNYKRFSMLAGVRSFEEEPSISPKGLPVDVSDSTNLYSDEWGVDGHSHSWLTLQEAVNIMLETNYANISEYAVKHPWKHFFNLDYVKNVNDYRFVFWFDN